VAAEKQAHLVRLNFSLRYHKVSPAIAVRVRQYISYLYTCGFYGEVSLYDDLPQSLAMAIDMQKKRPLIQAVEMFRSISAPCIVAIMRALEQVIFPPREYVMVQGSIGDCMYFIARGVVQITIVEHTKWRSTEIPVGQLTDGAHFGESTLIEGEGALRRSNALTLAHCEMQMLSRDEFNEICEVHVELAELLNAKRIFIGMYHGKLERSDTGRKQSMKEAISGLGRRLSRARSQASIMPASEGEVLTLTANEEGQSTARRGSIVGARRGSVCQMAMRALESTLREDKVRKASAMPTPAERPVESSPAANAEPRENSMKQTAEVAMGL